MSWVELPLINDIEGDDGMLSSYCWPLCFSKHFLKNGEIIFKLLGMLKALSWTFS
jgi:hypothetical protein